LTACVRVSSLGVTHRNSPKILDAAALTSNRTGQFGVDYWSSDGGRD
jgi:hypothetical protein